MTQKKEYTWEDPSVNQPQDNDNEIRNINGTTILIVEEINRVSLL